MATVAGKGSFLPAGINYIIILTAGIILVSIMNIELIGLLGVLGISSEHYGLKLGFRSMEYWLFGIL